MSVYIHHFVDKICVHHDADPAEVRAEFADAAFAALAELVDHPDLEVRLTTAGFDVLAPGPIPRGSDPAVDEAIERAVSDVVLKWFPWDPPPEGSVGRLLQDGGGWLRGLRGTCAGVTLEIVRARLEPRAIQPNSTWIEHDMTFALTREGVRTEYTIDPMGDHEGNLRGGLELEASPSARPRVEETLGAMAEQLVERDWDEVGGVNQWALSVAAAAQRPPADDSLCAWCNEELMPLLLAEPLVFEVDGGRLEIQRQEFWIDAAVFSEFKTGWLNVRGLSYQGDVLTDLVESSLRAGSLTPHSFDGAPKPETRGYARELVDRWHRALREELAPLVGPHGVRALDFDGPRMRLLDLVEFAHLHGPPPEPPVPRPDEAVVARGAGLVREPTASDAAWVAAEFGNVTAAPMATLGVADWLLVFGADRTRPPHHVSEIWLRDDRSGEAVQVLLTDVWNPTARWSIDGDAFAFRRFLQWLRGVLEVAGIDERYEFAADEWADDPAPTQMSLSEWLLFDEVGDDSDLLDWRCQSHVVLAGQPLEGAAGMFGFDAAFVKRLKDGTHTAIWRRFLRDVIDLRFDYSEGGVSQRSSKR